MKHNTLTLAANSKCASDSGEIDNRALASPHSSSTPPFELRSSRQASERFHGWREQATLHSATTPGVCDFQHWMPLTRLHASNAHFHRIGCSRGDLEVLSVNVRPTLHSACRRRMSVRSSHVPRRQTDRQQTIHCPLPSALTTTTAKSVNPRPKSHLLAKNPANFPPIKSHPIRSAGCTTRSLAWEAKVSFLLALSSHHRHGELTTCALAAPHAHSTACSTLCFPRLCLLSLLAANAHAHADLLTVPA